MTTNPTPAGPEPTGSLQERISDNVRYLLGKRRLSGRRLALTLDVSSSGVTNRLAGEVEWRPSEIEAAARALHVPWPWLLLEQHELVQKVTAWRPDGPDGGMATTR